MSSDPVLREQIRQIVREETLSEQQIEGAVEKGTLKVLALLGIDHENALEMQQDMAYLRRLRTGTSVLHSKVALGILSAFGTAIITFIILGFKDFRG